MWLAPEIPGYTEVRDFYVRYALKMGNVFSGGMGAMSAVLAQHPGATQGMADFLTAIQLPNETPGPGIAAALTG